MTQNISEMEALEQLGQALADAGWSPAPPYAEPFDKRDSAEPAQSRWRAMSFLKEYDPKIRAAICDGTTVKPEIIAGGTTVALVAQWLSTTGGFPIPVAMIANALVILGLTKFCRMPPKAKSEAG
ncbi:hypothetical protein [Roseovarius sp. M141]|uniref:hypothetical protein n=1 Tax=Roseovarius sp. M141 TaxID=2583806 RepID=UPI0020CD4F43|nr:hypothetical protein [Roseovarius sp. M141]MCQ0091300.1 hypothetical protein [Roseovarius sp. M141]